MSETFVEVDAGASRYAEGVSFLRIDSRSFVRASEQLGKHSDAGVFGFACAGSGGIFAGRGGVLGKLFAQADSSSVSVSSVTHCLIRLGLGILDNLSLCVFSAGFFKARFFACLARTCLDS